MTPQHLGRITWTWDERRNTLTAHTVCPSGKRIRVDFAVPVVAAVFEQELGRCVPLGTVMILPELGETITVLGFLKRIKKIARKVAPAPVKKAMAFTTKRLTPHVQRAARVADRVGRGAVKVASSPAFGAAAGGLAVAFPAVGGPAVAAYLAANKAQQAIKTYDQVRSAVSRGRQLPAARNLPQLAQRAQHVRQSVRALPRTPAGSMLRSALMSIR